MVNINKILSLHSQDIPMTQDDLGRVVGHDESQDL